MPLCGQHGNALHHSLVLENQELAPMRHMDIRMQRSEFYEGWHEVWHRPRNGDDGANPSRVFNVKTAATRLSSSIFNHSNPRDVQSIADGPRYRQFFNDAWREYRGKFVFEF